MTTPMRWPAGLPTRSPMWRVSMRSSTPVVEVLQGAQAQLQDAAHTLERVPASRRARARSGCSSSMSGSLRGWALRADIAGRRLSCRRCWQRGRTSCARSTRRRSRGAEREVERTRAAYDAEAGACDAGTRARRPRLSASVTQALQTLGMGGGRFEVALLAQERRSPSAWSRPSFSSPAMKAARLVRWRASRRAVNSRASRSRLR